MGLMKSGPAGLGEVRALRDAGRFLEAVRLAQAYTGSHPHDAAGFGELGLAQLHAGRVEEALPNLLRAVRLDPRNARYHESAGYALEALGRDGEALTAYRTALGCDPGLSMLHERLANLLNALERREEAAECYRRAAAVGQPARRAANRAMALRLEGRLGEAEAALREAIAAGAASTVNRSVLALILREQGRFDEAIGHLEAVTEGTPAEAADAYLAIAQSKRVMEADRPMLAPLKALLDYRALPETAHQAAHFALGKAYDDLGELENAMRHFDAGNALAARRRPFDRSQFGASVERVIASCGRDFLAAHRGDNPSQLPVLIVGMPRSGTTLVEQILSSHHAVIGADELPYWNRAAEGFGRLTEETAIGDWVARTGGEYVAELARRGPGALRVTDKTPGNFLWLGLYHLALPRARIVHCRRHPADTCLSNYFTLYGARMPFAYDKGDLAFYYRAYRRLMAHWREALPADALLEIDYEALVADPESVTRQLVAFLGLEWDPACLRPEENRRIVRTASQWQVRQKTYRTSVDRWKRYEPWLGELASLLDEPDGSAVHPQSGNAAIPLARRLQEQGRLDEAIGTLQSALRADLRDAVLFNELGRLLLSAGRTEEACESFWRALGLEPRFATARYNLGAALEASGRVDEAIATLRQALALDPRLGPAYSRLGNLLQRRGEETEALDCFRRARELLPTPADQELEEAKLLRAEGRHEAAVAKLRRVIELDAGSGLAHAMLGDALGEAGLFDEAIAHLRRAAEIDPHRVASTLYNIATLRRVGSGDLSLIAELERRLAEPRRGVLDRTLLHFALGKAYDDIGESERAITHFDAGNALERRGLVFDRDACEAQVDALIAAPLSAGPLSPESERALFIVGMPRSGTTLVEQILSAHPEVGAGGELPFWVDASQRAAQEPPVLAAEYLALLERIAPGAARVTDKNPFCFLALPLIRAALPGARIIHCRRDPVDTCLSIYFTRFATPQPFAYDRDDLAFYYRQYRRLMAHWRAVLPAERFLEVDYEALTASPEEEARRLVAFTGLAWDPRCLAPEANARVIRTASLWQARQPIYRQPVPRRERYARWLGPLAALAEKDALALDERPGEAR